LVTIQLKERSFQLSTKNKLVGIKFFITMTTSACTELDKLKQVVGFFKKKKISDLSKPLSHKILLK